MKVKLGARQTIAGHYVTVRTLKEAAIVVREFIEKNDCTAGCGSDYNSFSGGEILEDGEKIATVSYNGTVRDLAQQEIKL